MTKDLSVPLHRFLAAARQLEQDARFAADELAALCDVRVTAPVEARGALDAEALAPHVIKGPGRPVVVPESDPRPVLTSEGMVASEVVAFTDLTATT